MDSCHVAGRSFFGRFGPLPCSHVEGLFPPDSVGHYWFLWGLDELSPAGGSRGAAAWLQRSNGGSYCCKNGRDEAPTRCTFLSESSRLFDRPSHSPLPLSLRAAVELLLCRTCTPFAGSHHRKILRRKRPSDRMVSTVSFAANLDRLLAPGRVLKSSSTGRQPRARKESRAERKKGAK